MEEGKTNETTNHNETPEEDISRKWIQENPDLVRLAKPIKISNFKNELKKRKLDLTKVLEFITQTNQHTDKLFKNPVQFCYNRYETILPYEYNLVRLGSDPSDNYINANYISGIDSQTKHIATQAPLPKTIGHFWKMVHQEKVQSIFMLCNIEEGGKVQGYRYWPVNGDTEGLEVPGYLIKLNQKTVVMQKLIRRKMTVECLTTGDKKEVTQYHLRGWNDNEAPSSENMQALNALLQTAVTDVNEKKKVIVHCSAGVGRTGTFIALLNLRTLIKKNTEDNLMHSMQLSIFDSVRKLREQRWGMVYRAEQYIFIYEYLMNLLDSLKSS